MQETHQNTITGGAISCQPIYQVNLEQIKILRNRIKANASLLRIQYQFTTQTNIQMNCFSMMPPCVYPNPFQAHFPMRTTFTNENKAFSTPKVLNALSQALKKSIQNYEEKCTKNDENCPQIQEEATIKVENTKTVQKSVEIIIDEETPQENLKNTKEEVKSETEIKKVPTQDKSKEVLQQPTDDEIPSDSKSLNVISKKKNKKIRKEEKGNKYIVEVPQIDPIDTVSLPSFVLSTKALAKRKELLMLRKVNDPAEYMKIKKEKRQIRMLGN